jgi:hypothetical protein
MTGLLIFIGLVLITLNVLAIKKQNKSFNGTLGSARDNIDEYDIRIGELRRDFSESILDLQSEIMHLKETIEDNNRLNKSYHSQLDEKKYNSHKIEKESSIELPLEEINDIEINDIEINSIEANEKDYDENNTFIDAPSTNNSKSAKVEEITKLFSDGLSAEEISEILHLGKGEVLLIKDLYIR